jgi:hypothetical protein
MRIGSLFLLALISLFGFSQFQSQNVQLTNDMTMRSPTGLQQGGKIVKRDCLPDTLAYGRYKATGYRAISVSSGYSLGQFYESPDTVTYSGFQFYAWMSAGTSDTVTISCNMYLAGSDSLPSGNPVRSVTLDVDSTFGGGLLSVLLKQVSFQSYTTDQPVVFTVESSDTLNVAVVCNSFTATPPDGEGENLMSGSVAGVWYRGLNLNVGGTALDCDMVFEPYVKYQIFNDFTPVDCYKYTDSVILRNKSSAFFESKMYNLYTFYNLGYINHRWNYGHNTGYYSTKDGRIRYVSPKNYDVTLISTMYGITVRPTCVDTVKHRLVYQPAKISFQADTPVCSGNQVTISALANAPTTWYKKPGRVDSFHMGKSYQTPVLSQTVSYYAESVNEHCNSGLSKVTIPVLETPTDPAITEDSVCLNAKADLYATAPVGEVRWFADAQSTTAIDTGNYFQTPSLSSTRSYWVEVFNGRCTNGKRLEVKAHVNANFAPKAPDIISDTTVCLQTDSVTLSAKATGNDVVRWFKLPGDKVPLKTGNTYKVDGSKPTTTILFVDAFDGQCASSKSSILVKVNTFPGLQVNATDSVCQNDDYVKDLKLTSGSARWFTQETGGSPQYEGALFVEKSITADKTFWVETFEGNCTDTIRRAFYVKAIERGTIDGIMGDTTVCKGNSVNLEVESKADLVLWADNPDFANPLHQGSMYSLSGLNENQLLFVGASNLGCVGTPRQIQLNALDVPTGNFDYQILSPGNVEFTARQTGATSYEWDFGDGKSGSGRTVSHEFTKNGNFKVICMVVLSNGCGDTANNVLTIGGVTNSVGSVEGLNITVYPNPFSDQIIIDADFNAEKAVLYNGFGQLVQAWVRPTTRLNVKDLEQGLYYLKIQSADGHYRMIKLYHRD